MLKQFAAYTPVPVFRKHRQVSQLAFALIPEQ
jgi:hypothetical protein